MEYRGNGKRNLLTHIQNVKCQSPNAKLNPKSKGPNGSTSIPVECRRNSAEHGRAGTAFTPPFGVFSTADHPPEFLALRHLAFF
jgi:hypothetical protein